MGKLLNGVRIEGGGRRAGKYTCRQCTVPCAYLMKVNNFVFILCAIQIRYITRLFSCCFFLEEGVLMTH